MPARRQRSRSPSIACAVIAMIGTWPVAGLAGADPRGRLVAVDARHLAVHEHREVGGVEQLERLRRRPRPGRRRSRAGAASSRSRAGSPGCRRRRARGRRERGAASRGRGRGGSATVARLGSRAPRRPPRAAARAGPAWSGSGRRPGRVAAVRRAAVEVSITTARRAARAVARIARATSRPPISGIWPSSTTSSYGRPAARGGVAACASAAGAALGQVADRDPRAEVGARGSRGWWRCRRRRARGSGRQRDARAAAGARGRRPARAGAAKRNVLPCAAARLRGQLAAHHLDEPERDRQPEPGARRSAAWSRCRPA